MLEPLLNYIRPMVKDEHGQAFAEYALLIALVSVALMLVFQQLGGSLQGLLSAIEDVL